MKKFTVIAEYKGGTYVSQHYADTVDEAVMKWAENLDLQYFSEKEKRKINKELKYWADEIPAVLLDGLTNVWAQHVIVYRKSVFLNVVETVQ